VANEEKASILIVDDNPSNLRTLIDYLERWNFETLVATSGERAIQQLELFQPDLILLDVMMPGINGFETCRRLKANEATREIPVIFMTALSDTISKVAGFEVGGVDYVTKPVQYEELLARINAHLTIRKLQRQLQEQNTRFRALAEATFEGIIIHDQGQILEVNQAMSRLSGYQHAELIGKHVLELVAPASRHLVLTHLTTDDEQPYEIAGLKKDGALFTIEVQTRRMAYQGHEVRVAAVRDITERKRAEEKQKESQAQIERAKKEWESTADSLAYVVCLLDDQGKIIRANRTVELWNLSRVAEVKGRGVHELFHPACPDPACYLETFLARAWGEVAQGRSAECEVEDHILGRCLNIQVRPISLQLDETLKYSASFAVSSVNDITANKRMEGSLRQRNRELAVLNRMSDLFQACYTEAETYQVVSDVCQELLPVDAGCLYMLDETRTLVNKVVSWGSPPSEAQKFGTAECCALRDGRVQVIEQPETAPLCSHLSLAADQSYLCAPISVADQILGVVHLCFGQRQPGYSDADRKNMLTAQQMVIARVTEHYALVLVNLRLRETLRMEAIRDSLTNLYNRRYMEESLEREVHHAERHHTSIGIIMLDIDHFKTVNDLYGHEVGDLVLQELGALLRRHTRGEDIACRYGGEEFLLILPEAPLGIVRQRAEELRIIVRDFLRIAYQGNTLTITVSMGIAAFPNHGRTVRDVVHAADAALYQAKARGRDQVVVASG